MYLLFAGSSPTTSQRGRIGFAPPTENTVPWHSSTAWWIGLAPNLKRKSATATHLPTKRRQSTSTISLVWLHNRLISCCGALRTGKGRPSWQLTGHCNNLSGKPWEFNTTSPYRTGNAHSRHTFAARNRWRPRSLRLVGVVHTLWSRAQSNSRFYRPRSGMLNFGLS